MRLARAALLGLVSRGRVSRGGQPPRAAPWRRGELGRGSGERGASPRRELASGAGVARGRRRGPGSGYPREWGAAPRRAGVVSGLWAARGRQSGARREVKDGRWFEVSQGSQRGWLTRRYLALGAPPRPALAENSPSRREKLASPHSPEKSACPEPLRSRASGAGTCTGFPTESRVAEATAEAPICRGSRARSRSWTWMCWRFRSCKGTPRARRGLRELVSLLDRSTGGSWQAAVDDCPESSEQHVAVLYDAKRAKRLGGATISELNPHGEPCKDQLRPGIDAYLGFPGGLDLHVVSVHLKAGGKARDLALRQRSFESFSEAFDAAQRVTPDSDVLVLDICKDAIELRMRCARRRPGLADGDACARKRFRPVVEKVGGDNRSDQSRRWTGHTAWPVRCLLTVYRAVVSSPRFIEAVCVARQRGVDCSLALGSKAVTRNQSESRDGRL